MENVKFPSDTRWTIIEKAEDYVYPKSKRRATRFLCRCSCGVEKVVHKSHIICGSSKSCGCLNREISSTKGGKGYVGTREYKAWSGMRQRVKSSSDRNKCYQNISVCDRWEQNFESFLEDMGACPPGFELERLDNAKGYSKENCTWASETRQAQNRCMYSNNTSGYKGVCWSASHARWRVYLYRNKVRYEGGLYEKMEDAIEARRKLEESFPSVSI